MPRIPNKGRVKDHEFWESGLMNNETFLYYYNRLTELSVSMFEWQNLPDTVDERFLELVLFGDGMAVFFEDEVLGYVVLRTMIGGHLNLYQIPDIRTAYASNGYHKQLGPEDSVIIFNNMLHTNSLRAVEMFSKRLYNLDRIIDVNANAQKTPVLITCDETQRLTMLNLYKKYDGNAPVIFGDKNLNPNQIHAIGTGAPYVSDKIYYLKQQVWNEALTYLGISNMTEKRERLITDEALRYQGGTIASRYSRLHERQAACDRINRMFGLDIWVEYKADFDESFAAYVNEGYKDQSSGTNGGGQDE